MFASPSVCASDVHPQRTGAAGGGGGDARHCLNARSYALPRVYEATRRRGVNSDVLLPAMFPDSSPDVAHASSLCTTVLAQQQAAIDRGRYRPATGRRLEATVETPLFIRGVVMDKYFDDELLFLVHSMRKHMLRTMGTCHKIQIVDLGCGHGTRPWNLPLSSNVSWFDVDLPSVLEEKAALLEAAGAQMTAPPVHCDLQATSSYGSGQRSEWGGGRASDASAGSGSVPLRVGRYTPVVSHILKSNVAETLQQHGWDPEAPTIWTAFAFLYYLDSRAVDLVMKSIIAASQRAPCSAFAGTIMNAGMVELIREAAAGAADKAAAAAGGAGGPGGADAAQEGGTAGGGEEDLSSSMNVSDAMRMSEGVLASSIAMQWGCSKDVSSFLSGYAWDSVEEVSPFDVEQMFACLTVGMEYPEEMRAAIRQKHGHEPMCSVGIGRRGF